MTQSSRAALARPGDTRSLSDGPFLRYDARMDSEISRTDADNFEREVVELGRSERFMRFLETRSKETGVISTERFADELDADRHTDRPDDR